jgi:protein-disulfide isomerase
MSRKTQRNLPDPAAEAAAAARDARAAKRNVIIVGAALLLGLAAVLLWLNMERAATRQAADPQRQAPLASQHAPLLGEPSARVHVVEFIDPACETCAVFYPIVKVLMDEHPGQIKLSVRHVAFHEGAEAAVRVLEASRNQDRYWQTLEALFASQAQWAPHHTVQADLVLQAVAGVGLDMARLQADMNSPEVSARIERDRADAMALQVTKTPTYFVNGRPLPRFGEGPLVELITDELARAR